MHVKGARNEEEKMNISLILTKACNLKCKYCYEGGPIVRDMMSFETAKKALDSLKPSEVTFFGGEPLIQKELALKIIDYGIGLKIKAYSFTTNATLIDEDFLKELKSRPADVNFLVSIDGPENVHNRHRQNYKATEHGINLLKKHGYDPEARMTFTPGTIPHLAYSVYFLHGLGFNNIAFLPADSNKFDYTDDDYFEFMVQLTEILSWYDQTEPESRPRLKFLEDVKNTKNAPCGLGRGYVAVDEKGDIFPCHRFCFIPQSKIGNIETGLKNEMKEFYSCFSKYNFATCSTCGAQKYCFGSCPAANYFSHGHTLVPDQKICNFKRAEIELALNYLKEVKPVVQ
jgi:uncharacterized protein